MDTLGGFTALRFQGSVLRQSDLIRKSVRERSRVMMDLREVSHLLPNPSRHHQSELKYPACRS